MITEVSLDGYDGVISENRKLVMVFSFTGCSLDAMKDALRVGERIENGVKLACIAGKKTVALVSLMD